MRIHKGKPVFSYKDTYSLESVLSPIILSGLVKFRDVLAEREKNGNMYGVPIFDDNYSGEPQSEKWFQILDKMIFAFDDKNEPDIGNYQFSIDYKNDFAILNQEAYDNYKKDLERWNKLKQEGLDLFAKHYVDLWW